MLMYRRSEEKGTKFGRCQKLLSFQKKDYELSFSERLKY